MRYLVSVCWVKQDYVNQLYGPLNNSPTTTKQFHSAEVQKSKEAKMKAAMAGGKSRKKKWAKGKASLGLGIWGLGIYG